MKTPEATLKDLATRQAVLYEKRRELEHEQRQLRRRAASNDPTALRSLPAVRQRIEAIDSELQELHGVARLAAEDRALELAAEERRRRLARLAQAQARLVEARAGAKHLDALTAELADRVQAFAKLEQEIRQDLKAAGVDVGSLGTFGFDEKLVCAAWQIQPIERVLRQFGCGAPAIYVDALVASALASFEGRAIGAIERTQRALENSLPPAENSLPPAA
jgi:DNA repair exonuclease SbcCD ATPase subunit